MHVHSCIVNVFFPFICNCRCFFIAQSYVLVKKWSEALVLYERVLKYAKEVQSKAKSLNNSLKVCNTALPTSQSTKMIAIVLPLIFITKKSQINGIASYIQQGVGFCLRINSPTSCPFSVHQFLVKTLYLAHLRLGLFILLVTFIYLTFTVKSNFLTLL